MAFTLRWLSTTDVHFRNVGHLKNTLNIDENGEPLDVFIGEDGQEISPDAGMGVIQALDEAEADMRKTLHGCIRARKSVRYRP